MVEVLSGNRPPAQLIVHLKGILAQKNQGENVGRKKKILICFPHADGCMQFEIPDVKVMFYVL